jgi:L-ascorbate metabolism protein UlaG (beta-lactamase superfamily)
MSAPVITLIGGPTALIEAGGFRLMTDPTFDAPGEYKLPHVTLKKTSGPALTAEQIGPLDAVLLSHDQHADNFDRSGKAYAMRAPRLFTTLAGAQRLGGHAEGLAPFQSKELTKPDGTALRITATPARHGPVCLCSRATGPLHVRHDERADRTVITAAPRRVLATTLISRRTQSCRRHRVQGSLYARGPPRRVAIPCPRRGGACHFRAPQ